MTRQPATPQPPFTIDTLVQILADLRDPQTGCPWDREQSFATIAPYTIEEAYEVGDAIARNDMSDLRSELGDLLLQVIYHSRIAEEHGAFVFGDVVDSVCTKMIARHPHVYGDAASRDGSEQTSAWEIMKADERKNAGQQGALAGVALGLPALLRAEKLQKRAARVGFDWPDATGPRAKVAEELAECDAAVGSASFSDEIGDLLFSIVNWARHRGIDAELALRETNGRFERRFATVESLAETALDTLDPSQLDALWVRAKAIERREI